MIRDLCSMLALLTTAVFAQTATQGTTKPPTQAPTQHQGQRPLMPETPDTGIYYRLAPDAIAQDGVPKGELRGPFTLPSQAYPGTQHTYWVYAPAQYNSATSADLLVFNDGQAYMHPEGDARAQNVLDNLIYRREIPVMIGVFINPGRTPEQPEPNAKEWGDKTTHR